MAGVAKWLRLRFVVPVFVGSSPIIWPSFIYLVSELLYRWSLSVQGVWCGDGAVPLFVPPGIIYGVV